MERGFSLIELLTVIALIGIAAGLAVPSYRSAVINNRLAATSNDMVAALNLARSEAVKTGSTITVRADAAGWSHGWVVVAPSRVTGQAETVLQSYTVAEGMSVASSLADSTTLEFNPRGWNTTAASVFTIARQDATTNDEYRRCLIIRSAGSPRISKPKGSASCGAAT